MDGRPRSLLAGLAIAFLASGCRTLVTLEPEPQAPTPQGSGLRGTIEYEGDPLHLPRALVAAPAEGAVPAPTFRLDYQVTYQHSSNAQMLNPLLLIGGRFIGTDVTVKARLEILAQDEILKSYERRCIVRMRRSVWVWEQVTTSELRKQALACARDLLDSDLHRDREALAAMLERRAP